jgi:hypothetical protein
VCNKTLWSFPIPREKYFDLLPALPLNNCILLHNNVIFHEESKNGYRAIVYSIAISLKVNMMFLSL